MLQYPEITIEPLGDTNQLRIRANGRMIGHMGREAGASINLIQRFEPAVVAWIEKRVSEQREQEPGHVAMIPEIPEHIQNVNRAIDDIDDLDA